MNPIPSFEWRITNFCNYRCGYCFREKEIMRHCSDETISAVFDFLSKAKEKWLVKPAGGEVFLHPRFFEICKEIIGFGHSVCLNTNFSMPFISFQQLIKICGNSLKFINASLHLSQVKSIEEFIEKAVRFNAAKSPRTDFQVQMVVLEDRFNQLAKIEQDCKAKGIKFAFQLLRRGDQSQHINYDEKIEKSILGRLIKNTETVRNHDFFGTICYAGRWFFVININGNVHRCFVYQPLSYLGNITQGTFRRFRNPKPCLEHRCTCTVPANRNMICYNRRVKKGEVIKKYLLTP